MEAIAFGVIIGWPVGFVVGFLAPVRRRWLAIPALALALGWWIYAGWFGDAYDLGRFGTVVVTGLVAVGGFLGFAWALGLGRRLREKVAARRRS